MRKWKIWSGNEAELLKNTLSGQREINVAPLHSATLFQASFQNVLICDTQSLIIIIICFLELFSLVEKKFTN